MSACIGSCGLDVISPLRFAIDVTQATEAVMGLHKFAVEVITITNTGGIRPGVGGTRVRTDYRLSIGPIDFFAPPANSDGYLNPSFQQVSGRDVILSGNLLTNKDFKLGPLVYPYDTGFYEGGIDILLTNPPMQNNNLQLYFKVTGVGVPESGWYFKRVWGQEDSNLSYTIYLRNTAELPAI